MSYVNYPVKCASCGLHYTVHSWDEDWQQTEKDTARSKTAGGYCPECGTKGGKMLFTSKPEDGFIFEVVGDTPIIEITAVVQEGIGHGARTIERMSGRGPYGTNEGDVWLGNPELAPPGSTLVIEMINRDGVVEEAVYHTADPALVARAERGHELYIAEKASQS